MIRNEYINEELPFNREMNEVIGIDYANDGKTVRIDPIRCDIENWVETHEDVHDCIGNGQCERCANNNGFDSEYIEIRVKKPNKTFSFVRHKSHKLGGCWSNWYDNSYAITPAK